MFKYLLSILFIVSAVKCQQIGKLKIESSLPSLMTEISGIEKFPESELLWMINDSGNSNELYSYHIKSGKIVRSIEISNGVNKDWEDLAIDQHGTIFIGDFGNNNNTRKDLTIYSVEDVLNINRMEADALITTFYFEDQKKFPPKKKKMNFDVEAFIHFNDHFYLFTRNRMGKFNGITKLYRVPAKAGHFKAELIGQYKTCDQKKGCQITSATIHQESGTIALLSYNQVWLLSDYEKDLFFSGDIMTLELEHYSQKEAITFKDKNSLYITDERNGINGGNLYSFKIPTH